MSYIGVIFLYSYDEEDKAMDEGFPKFIAKGFLGMGPNIDAAVYYRGEYDCVLEECGVMPEHASVNLL